MSSLWASCLCAACINTHKLDQNGIKQSRYFLRVNQEIQMISEWQKSVDERGLSGSKYAELLSHCFRLEANRILAREEFYPCNWVMRLRVYTALHPSSPAILHNNHNRDSLTKFTQESPPPPDLLCHAWNHSPNSYQTQSQHSYL